MAEPAALDPAYLERLEEALGPDVAERIARHAALPIATTVRVNTLVASPAEVADELAPLDPEPVPWSDAAFVLRGGDARAVQATAAFERGALYLQGLSSMAAPLVLDVRPGMTVLDAAAAPGSKTSQIAALLRGEGTLVANDRSRARGFKLRAVLEHQRVTGVELFQRDAAAFGRTHVEAFDRVLFDAPCSGEGRFRLDDPGSLRDWKPGKVKRLAADQRRMLLALARTVKPGGLLVCRAHENTYHVAMA